MCFSVPKPTISPSIAPPNKSAELSTTAGTNDAGDAAAFARKRGTAGLRIDLGGITPSNGLSIPTT